MKYFTAVTCALIASFHLAGAAPAPQPEAAVEAAAAGTSVSVSYDPKFDVKGSSLNTVACSDGANGLVTKGYSTFGSLPSFPRIGGAPTIAGWNSANCGKCYSLSYKGKSIKVLAIDAAPGGFNIGVEAMNLLTNNQAVQLGRVTATYTPLAASACGL
ncbi:Cerato-platanin-domain-containing protein [Penicillium argentinense]|uniref:Cerato-platanin-domain-containing protein n=1 Tax=Penicillium argentinense TaxID=1131581 RepID=A0A9W9KP58_9EURO|nr:Cerato-platanin-domain-containing protein [Penicillium argentinense]KAJ5112727.1 Cerato-platanin-domain-containing protein [Penicillium argentinense]